MCHCFYLAFLTVHLKSAATDPWIGLNDINIERMFVWTDGSGVHYTNWAKGFPGYGVSPACKGFHYSYPRNKKYLLYSIPAVKLHVQRSFSVSTPFLYQFPIQSLAGVSFVYF